MAVSYVCTAAADQLVWLESNCKPAVLYLFAVALQSNKSRESKKSPFYILSKWIVVIFISPAKNVPQSSFLTFTALNSVICFKDALTQSESIWKTSLGVRAKLFLISLLCEVHLETVEKLWYRSCSCSNLMMVINSERKSLHLWFVCQMTLRALENIRSSISDKSLISCHTIALEMWPLLHLSLKSYIAVLWNSQIKRNRHTQPCSLSLQP